jgi:tripartite-type tricarboxylate transporter receptor subunit TctC
MAMRGVVPLLTGALLLTACGTGGTGNGDGDCDGYPERDIELVVPYSAGGGYDRWGRMVADALPEHLPNDVNVIVRNVEGGGGLVGANQVLGGEPDGYQLLLSDPGNLASGQLQGGLEVDPTEITTIGRVTTDPQILLVNPDSGIETIEDLKSLSEERPILQADSDVSPLVVATYEAFGIPFEFVLHEGGSEARLSVIRGDTDAAMFSHLSVLEEINAGDLNGILYIGEEKPAEGDPGYEEVVDMQTIADAGHPELAAPLEQHRMLLAAPGVPDCARDILEGALEEAINSEGFQAQADEAQLAPRFASAEDSAEIMEATVETFTEYREEIEQAQE